MVLNLILATGDTLSRNKRLLPNEIFLARTRKNLAQDRSVLPVHEDLSNGFDQVDGEKKPLGSH
ncbi:MAG: hypothetical protein LBT70_00325 [Holosporaceae bacterium]|nr:hypothetical protein [Holosporaceae bacterium]